MHEKIAVIRRKLAIAQERQKKYANQRRRELQFEVGSKVFLKVGPMKGIMRFGYVLDPTHVLEYEPLQVREDLTYEEFPVGILAQKTQALRKKTIPMVKVLWSNHTEKQATWELEENMRIKYPYLFDRDGDYDDAEMDGQE
ncbi:hypothetical protein F2P56_018815 [Juglans regia]|uniref:Uncharacterized protein LOC108986929 n=2 Tax=Juglans regia TaxID=51240 RepID=A0A2I4E7B2_JUGRE|nr:uncharacterized protein LOC108986929 [Juglans regia]KAF5462842.1 hypothetical protein F2P56_018815 [Juglans regia]